MAVVFGKLHEVEVQLLGGLELDSNCKFGPFVVVVKSPLSRLTPALAAESERAQARLAKVAISLNFVII